MHVEHPDRLLATSRGDGPMIEIFDDRVVITNPGKPLMDTNRLIDTPPRSRNETLADFMRRLRFFEGRGSGIDKAIGAIERMALTPPLFRAVANSTVVTTFAGRKYNAMTKDDRIRACYQHASVRWEAGSPMNNESLRNRLGLAQSQYTLASQVIADTRDAGLIKPRDENQANRVAKYVPFWAG